MRLYWSSWSALYIFFYVFCLKKSIFGSLQLMCSFWLGLWWLLLQRWWIACLGHFLWSQNWSPSILTALYLMAGTRRFYSAISWTLSCSIQPDCWGMESFQRVGVKNDEYLQSPRSARYSVSVLKRVNITLRLVRRRQTMCFTTRLAHGLEPQSALCKSVRDNGSAEHEQYIFARAEKSRRFHPRNGWNLWDFYVFGDCEICKPDRLVYTQTAKIGYPEGSIDKVR